MLLLVVLHSIINSLISSYKWSCDMRLFTMDKDGHLDDVCLPAAAWSESFDIKF
jgi:hypothetical protein